MDGLQIFIDQTWDTIKHQKELNLPDQRQMVANFRCNEIKAEAVELVTEKVHNLKTESERSILSDFQSKC